MSEKPNELTLVGNLPTARARQQRANRLDPDWVPDPGWHRANGWSDAQATYELEKFRDYWCAKAGRDATKHDWQRTWRNWLRKAAEMGQGPRAARPAWSEPEATTTQRVGSALRLAEQLEREGR